MPVAWTAYCLATAYHETAHTMQPIKEAGGAAYYTRMYDIQGNRPDVARTLGNLYPGDGAKYAGRGYVQLTGRTNYAKASNELGLGDALITTPDRAMEDQIAAKVMRLGMVEGWFTGKGLDSFLSDDRAGNLDQFINCRRIINGYDRAPMIAGYAMEFQLALQMGEWVA
jgi:putative chitinase